MSIPLVTTHITIKGTRPLASLRDPDADGFDAVATPPSVIASGLNACISGPVTIEQGGAQVEVWNLRVDPCDLHRTDIVLDETTGDQYTVSVVTHSKMALFGLNHTHALLKLNKGLPDDHSTAS